MQLYENWKSILKKAWSIKLMFFAGVFSGVEAILPLFQESFPRGVFASLSIVTVTAAFVSRLIAQKDV